MEQRNIVYSELKEEVKEDIMKVVKQLEKKHGFKAFRMVANHYINSVREEDKLKKIIAEKERELQALKLKKI